MQLPIRPVLAAALAAALVSGSACSGARSTDRLYLTAGSLDHQFIASLSIGTVARQRNVFFFPSPSRTFVWPLAVTPKYVYWSGYPTRNSGECLFRGNVFRKRYSRIVCGLGRFVNNAVVTGGSIYWVGKFAIGRATADGRKVDRRFAVPSPQYDDDVANSLATDGKYLFFSRCFAHHLKSGGFAGFIGRVRLDGSDLNERFIKLPNRTCPLSLAYTDKNLYWPDDNDGGTAGLIWRVSVDGSEIGTPWRNIRSSGIYDVTASGGHIYWQWGGQAGAFLARVSISGRVEEYFFKLPRDVAVVPFSAG